MKHWVETYPHDIYASALLLDGKIENWKVGQRRWESPMQAKAIWNFERFGDYTTEFTKWTVQNDTEHKEVFEKLAPEWFLQWEMAENFKFLSPHPSK